MFARARKKSFWLNVLVTVLVEVAAAVIASVVIALL
jgi:hypothetical protein